MIMAVSTSDYRTAAIITPQVIRPGRSSLRTTFQLAADVTIPQGMTADDVFLGAACEALRDLTQLEFFFDQVDIVSMSQEIRPKVKLVVKDSALPQNGSPESLGRDAQAELFVFGACRKAGLNPAFHEPDIVCILDGQPLALGVKRVKNMRQLLKRIKEGARQITRGGDYGIIFVDVVIEMNPKNYRVIARMPDAAFGLAWSELLRRGIMPESSRQYTTSVFWG